ncbi:MAG: radical SAM family heme chaperone HemW [Clostridia bacterium]|jgi:putative oxygen-independent coproporphyrinogen III oxidase|nr:radical SAM family heme chaperone HemW [Clostridia bacterium]NLS85340.1 radical SAM family heme chaperone HemW [Oscillospiraceae bacterium]
MFGIYCHIPYCASKCRYCSFYSKGGSGDVPQGYVDALIREIWRFEPCGSVSLRPDTLYFGGGTPSLLTPAQVCEIIDAAGCEQTAEITLEANPDTVTYEKLCAYKNAGVNRLSFGVQTANDDSLKRIGRSHDAKTARAALEAAQKAGFDNISGDVMLALPYYTSAELDATLDLLSICTHISAYILKIEPNSIFGKKPPDGLPSDDEAADFYLEAVDKLAARGYAQYEISNFAQKRRESRHNLIYWNVHDYLGIGAAAHSCMGGKRFSTPENAARFIEKPVEYVQQGVADAADYIMLKLRLTSGLSLPALKQKYGVSFTARQFTFIEQLVKNEMATFDGETLALTPRGLIVQNSVLMELL